jgi:hypothetical protein
MLTFLDLALKEEEKDSAIEEENSLSSCCKR